MCCSPPDEVAGVSRPKWVTVMADRRDPGVRGKLDPDISGLISQQSR
jgi:hypothetical protein